MTAPPRGLLRNHSKLYGIKLNKRKENAIFSENLKVTVGLNEANREMQTDIRPLV